MAIDFTKQYVKYRGQWVGLKDDQKTVVASGRTAKSALKKARAKGVQDPILFKIPRHNVHFVGHEISLSEISGL